MTPFIAQMDENKLPIYPLVKILVFKELLTRQEQAHGKHLTC